VDGGAELGAAFIAKTRDTVITDDFHCKKAKKQKRGFPRGIVIRDD
jgi:hypothetical protein